jgi:anti-sigma factor RsiW
MSTRRDTKIIHKVLDGEASKSETKILRDKLKQDLAVQQEYEGLKRIEEISRDLGAPATPPPGFTDRVLRDIRRNPGPRA